EPRTELLIRHADHCDVGDIGVCKQQLLDLGREDVLATGDDHVVVTALDGEPARLVESADVTGRDEPVDTVLVAAARVALERHRVADEDAAGLARCHVVALLIEESYDGATQRPPDG